MLLKRQLDGTCEINHGLFQWFKDFRTLKRTAFTSENRLFKAISSQCCNFLSKYCLPLRKYLRCLEELLRSITGEDIKHHFWNLRMRWWTHGNRLLYKIKIKDILTSQVFTAVKAESLGLYISSIGSCRNLDTIYGLSRVFQLNSSGIAQKHKRVQPALEIKKKKTGTVVNISSSNSLTEGKIVEIKISMYGNLRFKLNECMFNTDWSLTEKTNIWSLF